MLDREGSPYRQVSLVAARDASSHCRTNISQVQHIARYPLLPWSENRSRANVRGGSHRSHRFCTRRRFATRQMLCHHKQNVGFSRVRRPCGLISSASCDTSEGTFCIGIGYGWTVLWSMWDTDWYDLCCCAVKTCFTLYDKCTARSWDDLSCCSIDLDFTLRHMYIV